MRRTDHYAHQIGLSKDNGEYEAFAARHPEHRIFLATDNAETQTHFARRFGERLVVTAQIGTDCSRAIAPNEVERHTPLSRDAVIDLFVCATAEVFKGSPWSSFSDAICHMRRVMRAAHREDEHELVEPPADAVLRVSNYLK